MGTPKPVPKPEDGWRQARLLATTGIGGQDEQEQRATSSLLAVMYGVPQFGRAIVQHFGAPAGRVATFTEIRFEGEDQKLSIPDGAIVVERGQTRWVCLVEVKTGGTPLRLEQVNRYLDLARSNGFDAVLTISNQITTTPTESPLVVDARRLKKVALRHLSWWQVMTEALVQHRHRGITDPDQAWVLGELIAYLDHEKAGAGRFEGMGDKWVAVRDGARQRSLRLADPAVREVSSRWEQFVHYLALGLCQDLGREVEPVWPKKLEQTARLDLLVGGLVEQGKLLGSIRVPDAIAAIDLEADLRTRLFTTSVAVAAPREGRPKTRISWMLRQLKDAPESLRVEVQYPNARETTSAVLRDARLKPEKLFFAPDPKREPRAFRLSQAKEIGTKGGAGLGSFVREARLQAVEFYRVVVQQIRPWAAEAPKLPVPGEPATPGASTNPPDFSATDKRGFGEATEPQS